VPKVTTSPAPTSDAPFGDALRTAVRGRGLTLDRIRWHLARRGVPVGLSTLSDWQHGRSVPASDKSLRAVQALEEILELSPDTLAHRISLSRRAPRAPERLDESASPISRLLQAVTDTSGEFDLLARRCQITVDRHRRASVMGDSSVIRARVDGLDRYTMRYIGDPGCDIDQVRFSELGNCRLGRVARQSDPVEPALVAELLFDHPLRVGETWMFDTEMVDETGEPCSDYAHGFRQPVSQFAMEICFDVAAEPVRPHSFAEDGLGTGRQHLQDLQLSSHRTVHVVASDVRSGVLGVAWSWGDVRD
jgi:hypothetical protein